MTVRSLFLPCWGLAFALAPACGLGEEVHWRELPLPASPERLAIAAGIEPPVERWRLLYDVSSRVHPATGGQAEASARLQAVASELARSRVDPAGADPLLLPVPMSPDVWREAVLESPVADADLTRALVLERSASLVYRALCQLDPETLAFFVHHSKLLKEVRVRQPEVFALVAGSLRIRAGSAVVPGGAEAIPLWEGAIGARVTEPESFLRRLLTRGDGRLALLLHIVDGLDPARRRFALGLSVADPRRRGARFRALLGVFARTPRWWQAQAESPLRPRFDLAAVLARVEVDERGALRPPASRAFWQSAFTDGKTARDALDAGESVDAAWLAERICLVPTPLAQLRVTQLTFAQRVFEGVPASSLPAALDTVRQLGRRPALVYVLERIGFDDPRLYAEVLRGAETLEALPRRHDRVRALAQFTATLALIDRSRQNAVLDLPSASALAVSLSRVRPSRLGYWDALASWLDEDLLSPLAAAVGVAQPLGAEEHVWLCALAGARATPPPTPDFDWEGLPTRADPASSERSRFAKVRARQGGNSLDTALALTRLARAAAASGDRERALAGLQALAIEPTTYPDDGSPDLPALRRAVSAGRTQGLLRLADGLLADTLVALAYAPHLGPPDGAVLSGASVARRHDLSDQPFALPRTISGGEAPWHVEGSLLALEVALAPLSLRRITPDLPPRPPACDQEMLASFALAAVLRSPSAMRDSDADRLAAAIERGRARVNALTADPSPVAAVARDAALGPWRTQALPWLLAHEPGALDGFFSLAELLRLGGPLDLPQQAWGLPALALGEGLRLQRPPASPLERSQGQDRRQLLAAALEDPLLKVVTELAARRLPACLTPAMLLLLTQSIADEGPAELRDDPYALARFLRTLPPDRFDDYVSALAGDGPLLPATAAEPGGVP